MADWLPRSTTAAAAMVGLAGSAAYMWANSDPEGLVVDQSVLSMQSRPHPDIPACRTSLSEDLVDDKKTLYDNLLTAVKKFGTSPYFGWRTSSETGFDNWLTYDEVLDRSTHVGAGLRYLGQKPSNDTLIGMFSKNRVEMMLTQYACYQHSMAIVPMYDTLGEEGIEHIVNQTKMQLIICDDEAKIKELLKSGSEKFPHVKQIVFMDAVSVEIQQAVQEQKWEIMSFTEMEITGRKNPVQLQPAKPEDICVICYTSGTTGRPKGAMIEHRGLMHVAAAAMAVFPLSIGKELLEDGTESYLSYLPLAHMYEQVMMVGLTIYGTRIGFYSGDVKELLNDIKFMAPTIFASVPRLLNRVYDKVMAAVSQSAVKSWLFQTALQKKEEYFKRGIITKSTIWDKLVFKKVQDTLGGNVKLIVTGAAPISPPVLRFLRLAIGAGVCEGYGQTECSAAMTVTLLGDQAVGEVGPPLACCTIKLADVPEMNYYASDNIGEVCCSGKLVFKGYLHDEIKTNEAIDSEGWLHTGDIGIWTDRGTLKIVDRKKNIFKLAQGEYVAPEKIENVYISCPLVGQCFIHGDSLKASLVAIVVPDADTLPAYAKSQLGLNISDMSELCADEKVKSAIMRGMSAAAKTFNLKGFEQTRDIYLSPEPFSVENDLLTPTFKLKRVQARKMYRDVIDDMYEHLQ